MDKGAQLAEGRDGEGAATSEGELQSDLLRNVQVPDG